MRDRAIPPLPIPWHGLPGGGLRFLPTEVIIYPWVLENHVEAFRGAYLPPLPP